MPSYEILTENLQTRSVAAKFVPQLSTLERKENNLTIYRNLKNVLPILIFLKKCITSQVVTQGFMS